MRIGEKKFLYGPAGTGKSTRGLAWLSELTRQTHQGVVVYVPQRTHAAPYQNLIVEEGLNQVDILTVGGLARRMVELFWPMISEEAGFANPGGQPNFLNLESAQYSMAQVVRPLEEEGYFDSVVINRHRLHTQILDDLNKAALNGYGLEELGRRLTLGSTGDPDQARIFQDAQTAVRNFRDYCLGNNMLDFSLQVDVFMRYLWQPGSVCQDYLQERYRHIIVDNLEETTPVEHDLLAEWLAELDSALLIYDEGGGYRTFLGADPVSGFELRRGCDAVEKADASFQSSETLSAISARLGSVVGKTKKTASALTMPELTESMEIGSSHFYPEMLDWVAEKISGLVLDEGVDPGKIVVLSPFLSDSLRYSLGEKLASMGVGSRSHRPSRSLRDEPETQAVLTLARVAHPEWKVPPSHFDLAYAFMQVLGEIDLVRSQLLAEAGYSFSEGAARLAEFSSFGPETQERIGFAVGERYDILRKWMAEFAGSDGVPLDHFLVRLFGEVLSQPGFGLHGRLTAGSVIANLSDSFRSFRTLNEGRSSFPDYSAMGAHYLQMIQEGLIAAQYLRSWLEEDEDSVLMAPAYTFLMRNQAVDYQFWLDISSHGWHERIYQPLTHPYVLNRNWPLDRPWTDRDEVERENESLHRLFSGLLRRCNQKVYLAISDLSESGHESSGLLIRALQQVYQQIAQEGGG